MSEIIYKRHVVVEMDETMIQRCILCGEVISDYRGAMVPDGQPMPKGFSAGEVFVSTGNPRISMTTAPYSFYVCT